MFALRSVSYLTSRLKVPATEALFELGGVDVFEVDQPTMHISRHPRSFLARQRAAAGQGGGAPPYTIAVQFMNPGAPPDLPFVSITLYFVLRPPLRSLSDLLASGRPMASPPPRAGPGPGALRPPAPAAVPPMDGPPRIPPRRSLARRLDLARHPARQAAALRRFLAAPPEEQSRQFKMIAHIANGPRLLRSCVPVKPVIVGTAIGVPMPVFASDEALEIDLRIDACAWAARFYKGFVAKLSPAAVADIAFLFEGQRPEELPEELVGVARLSHVGPALARRVEPLGDPPDCPYKTIDTRRASDRASFRL